MESHREPLHSNAHATNLLPMSACSLPSHNDIFAVSVMPASLPMDLKVLLKYIPKR